MHQYFKIATLILFLGFFILPKASTVTAFIEDACCTSLATDGCEMRSVKEETPCHSEDKKEDSKDCHDCHSCASIGFFADLQSENLSVEPAANFRSSHQISFYLSPEFSNFASKIWQPPKII